MELTEDEKRLAAWCLHTVGDQLIARRGFDRKLPTQVAQDGYRECYRVANKLVGGTIRTKVRITEIEGGSGGDL